MVISAAQPGAGPSEIEALVTRRIEDAVAGLANIRHITSTVSDGASTTVVEFVLGKNIDSAVNDIRDKVADIRADLPAGMRDPVVTHVEAVGRRDPDLRRHLDRTGAKSTCRVSSTTPSPGRCC